MSATPTATRPRAEPGTDFAVRSEPGRRARPGAFARTVAVHLALSAPTLAHEQRRWREAAHAIPDHQLRHSALTSLAKQGNIEGAALFASLAPRATRRPALRALIAYQAAYNYLDELSEQPNPQPLLNAGQLHRALLVALHPAAPHENYYRQHPAGSDGGYLREMIDTCRSNLAQLPAYLTVAPHARAATARILDYQTLSAQHREFERAAENFARELLPSPQIHWWETLAAAGSSLPVFALFAAAADPATGERDARAIADAYFPCPAALHSLLDSLIDREQDRREGQPSLIEHYENPAYAAYRLTWLAEQATRALAGLPRAGGHQVILTAMASYYLTAPGRHTRERDATASALTSVLGPQLTLATHMFAAKRLSHKLAGRRYT